MPGNNRMGRVRLLFILLFLGLILVSAPVLAQEEDDFTWEGKWDLYGLSSDGPMKIEIGQQPNLKWVVDFDAQDEPWHPPLDITQRVTKSDNWIKVVTESRYQELLHGIVMMYLEQTENPDQLRGAYSFYSERAFTGNENGWSITEQEIRTGLRPLCAARPGTSPPDPCMSSGEIPEDDEGASEDENDSMQVSLSCEPTAYESGEQYFTCTASFFPPEGSADWETHWSVDRQYHSSVTPQGRSAQNFIFSLEPGSHSITVDVINFNRDVELTGKASVIVVVEEPDKALPVSLYCQPDIKPDGETDFLCGVDFYPPEESGSWFVHWYLDGNEITVLEAEDGRSSTTFSSVTPGLHNVSVMVLNPDPEVELGGSGLITVGASEEAADQPGPPASGGDSSDNSDDSGADSANPPGTNQGSIPASNEVSPGAQAGAAAVTTGALAFWFIWEFLTLFSTSPNSPLQNFLGLLASSGPGGSPAGSGTRTKPPSQQQPQQSPQTQLPPAQTPQPSQPPPNQPTPAPDKPPVYTGGGTTETQIFSDEDVHVILQGLDLIPDNVGPGDTLDLTQAELDALLSGHPDGQPHQITLPNGNTVIINSVQGIAFHGDEPGTQIDFDQGISIAAEIIDPDIPLAPPSTPMPNVPSGQTAQPSPSQPIDQTSGGSSAGPDSPGSQGDQSAGITGVRDGISIEQQEQEIEDFFADSSADSEGPLADSGSTGDRDSSFPDSGGDSGGAASEPQAQEHDVPSTGSSTESSDVSADADMQPSESEIPDSADEDRVSASSSEGDPGSDPGVEGSPPPQESGADALDETPFDLEGYKPQTIKEGDAQLNRWAEEYGIDMSDHPENSQNWEQLEQKEERILEYLRNETDEFSVDELDSQIDPVSDVENLPDQEPPEADMIDDEINSGTDDF